jgi:hypothetical protein
MRRKIDASRFGTANATKLPLKRDLGTSCRQARSEITLFHVRGEAVGLTRATAAARLSSGFPVQTRGDREDNWSEESSKQSEEAGKRATADQNDPIAHVEAQ